MAMINADKAKGDLLDALAEGSTLKDAAAKAGVSPAAHYQWLRSEPSYKAAYDWALEIRADRLEEVAEQRAVQGYEEVTVYYEHGEETSRKVTRKYSDGLLQMLLKASKPQKFKDRVQQEITGDAGIIETLAAARKRLQASRPDADKESNE